MTVLFIEDYYQYFFPWKNPKVSQELATSSEWTVHQFGHQLKQNCRATK